MIAPRLAVTALVFIVMAATCYAAGTNLPDAAVIDRLTGLKGKASEKEGVYKVQLPRSDIKLKVAGAKVTPAMGLTCWAAFKKAGEMTMVMGDIVLQEDQIDSVMDAALNNGLQVTGLHNHFTFDNPRIMYMHIGGMGNDTDLATAVGKVFSAVKGTAGGKAKHVTTGIDPAKSKLTASRLEAVLGKGDYKDGEIGRAHV